MVAFPASVLITGIGLGLVEVFLKNPQVKHVFATARDVAAATELTALKTERLHILKMDVLDDRSIEAAAKQVDAVVGAEGLNLLINNSGIFESYKINEAPQRSAVDRVLAVNATSQLVVCQYFIPLLKRAASPTEWGIHKAAIVSTEFQPNYEIDYDVVRSSFYR